MVTGYVTGVGVGVGTAVTLDPALTPAQEVATMLNPITAQMASARALRLPCGMPMKTNPATPRDSSHLAESGTDFRDGGKLVAEAEVAAIVRAELVGVEPMVMLAGEKEQAHPVGSPAQESETGLLNVPDCGFAVTVKFPDWPVGMVTVDGDALRDRLGGVGGGVGGGGVGGGVGGGGVGGGGVGGGGVGGGGVGGGGGGGGGGAHEGL
jgi:hypothetical protein